MKALAFLCIALSLVAQTTIPISGAGSAPNTSLVVGTDAANVAATAAKCPTTAPACYVIIGSTYTGADAALSYSSNYAVSDTSAYPANVQIVDMRGGHQGVTLDQQGTGFNNKFWNLSKWTILGGGLFDQFNVSKYGHDMSVWYPKTLGQFISAGSYVSSSSPSDVLGFSRFIGCLGGNGGPSFAEGCKWGDALVVQGDQVQGTVEWEGPSQVAGTGLTSILVGTPIQGASTLGVDQDVVDITTGGTPNTVIAQVSTEGYGSVPMVVTYGTPVAASTAIGTVATGAINPGQQIVVPTVTVGTMTGLNGLVCIADPVGGPERALAAPSSSGGISVVTRKPHGPNWYISSGGQCGDDLEFNADREDASTFPEIWISGVGIHGIFHRAWFVMANPDTTHAIVAYWGKGGWRQLDSNSSWNANAPNNAVTIWSAARVIGLGAPGADAGKDGGTIATEPNNLTINSGDTLAQFKTPSSQITTGDINILRYHPNHVQAGGGFHLSYWGIATYNDTDLATSSYTDPHWYRLQMQDATGTWQRLPGNYDLPLQGWLQEGMHSWAERFQYPGAQGQRQISGCMPSPIGCSNSDHPDVQYRTINAASDAQSFDELGINQATGEWYISAKNRSIKYRFKASGPVVCTEASTESCTPISTGNSNGPTVVPQVPGIGQSYQQNTDGSGQMNVIRTVRAISAADKSQSTDCHSLIVATVSSDYAFALGAPGVYGNGCDTLFWNKGPGALTLKNSDESVVAVLPAVSGRGVDSDGTTWQIEQ